MHLFVDRSFLEAAGAALPLFFRGGPGQSSPALPSLTGGCPGLGKSQGSVLPQRPACTRGKHRVSWPCMGAQGQCPKMAGGAPLLVEGQNLSGSPGERVKLRFERNRWLQHGGYFHLSPSKLLSVSCNGSLGAQLTVTHSDTVQCLRPPYLQPS